MSISALSNAVSMSSREIADLVGSRHADVIRTIDRLRDRGAISGCSPSAYTHEQNGQLYHQYLVGKRDSYVIVAQLSPEFTAALVDRWQELEARHAPKIPQTMAEALRLAADQAEQIERQQAELAIAAPKAEFVDRYVDAHGLYGFRQVAKMLRAKENEFSQWLQDTGIMYRLGGRLTPCAAHLDTGRFEVKAGASEGGHAFTQAKFTAKGFEWVAGKWAARQLEEAQ